MNGQLTATLKRLRLSGLASEAVALVNITNDTQHGVLTWRGTTRELSLKPWGVKLLKQ